MNRGHGSPYDRGSADAWYARRFDPHWYPKGTYVGDRVSLVKGTPEYVEYKKGYDETPFGEKDWD